MVGLEETGMGEWEEMEGGWTSGRASDRAKDGGGKTGICIVSSYYRFLI